MLTRTTYTWGATTYELTALVVQDCADSCDSELCVLWDDESLDVVRWLSPEERVGAVDAIEEAFWSSEREQCRVANVKNRTEVAA